MKNVLIGESQVLSGEFLQPGGKQIYIGTGYFERYDGEIFEWNGVVPDIRIPQTGQDTDMGRDMQLEFAMEWIRKETISPKY